MKILYNIIAICIALLLNLSAQGQGLRNNPALLERLTQAKLIEIQKALNLSEAKMKELSPVYKRYDAELYEVHFARQALGVMRANPDSLSAEEADKMVTVHLDNAVKISTIRRKYYPEFKAVLTPQQVMKLYQSEAQIRRMVMQEIRNRFGNRLK